jgi:riboflavin transporter FmnP
MIEILFLSYPLTIDFIIGFTSGVLCILVSGVLNFFLRDKKIEIFSTVRNCVVLGSAMSCIFGGSAFIMTSVLSITNDEVNANIVSGALGFIVATPVLSVLNRDESP